MAEVLIAAAPGEDARARGLAEALAALGFDAAAGAPAEAEIAGAVDGAKCILTLWSGTDPPASLAVLATLALERKKLISAETAVDATPTPFRGGPRIALAPRDRNAFRDKFRELVTELDKFSTNKGNMDALPAALATARAALVQKQTASGPKPWRTLGVFAGAVAILFIVGFGAGRVIDAARRGELHFSLPTFPRAAPTAARTPETAPPTPTQPDVLATLETAPWRDSAARLGDAAPIKAGAERGEARAQALACLGHLAGVEGFLPSPTAAREFCDASAAQNDPAGLYFSWILRRTAPHSGIPETVARERLAQAAARGWLPAIIDYGEVLSEPGSSLQAHAEAGRLFLAAAERGDARGQFFYARWLRDSPAGPRDPSAAIPFLQRAADQNQRDALHMLATLYRDGVGVTADASRARALYDRAAQQNYPPSMFNLADLLRDGSEQDRARAIALYRQLACMRDERQIAPMASRRLAALRETAQCP
ncbi:MAG: sel1 repeat family protein [Hyphomonadaceae bacterium]|nr:sel1 repeat family protein [Hyphomonadaceae bacterium]